MKREHLLEVLEHARDQQLSSGYEILGEVDIQSMIKEVDTENVIELED